MTDARRVFVFGASGHAKVVIDAIEREGRDAIAFVCDDAADKQGTELMGYRVVGGREALLERRMEAAAGIVAIGDNRIRMNVAAWLVDHGWQLTPVVHPAAAIARDVEIGEGTVVMAGCVINSGARIGRNAIVNTGATIDHDCEIGDGVHVAPGAHLCGHVAVGAGSFVGAGTTIVPLVHVGCDAVIGAGSTVLQNLPDQARVAGSPCRPLAS
jgi:sugar O-acyltransferase (sialic acid O-acetyltransferase NeuD family)